MAAMRLLLLGKNPNVMARLLAELQAQGIPAVGSTAPERATTEFDAGQLDVIGLGGGFSDAERQELKCAFQLQNPAVLLVDLAAATAVAQLRYLARKPAETPLQLGGVRAAQDAIGAWTVRFTATAPLDVTVAVHQYTPALTETVLFQGEVSAGEAAVPLPVHALAPAGKALFLTVAAVSGEIAVGRSG